MLGRKTLILMAMLGIVGCKGLDLPPQEAFVGVDGLASAAGDTAAPPQDTAETPEDTGGPGPDADTAAEVAEPADTADALPEDTADADSGDTADAAPEDTADAAPEDTADAAPKDTADAAPEDTADAAPEDTADAEPADTSDASAPETADDAGDSEAADASDGLDAAACDPAKCPAGACQQAVCKDGACATQPTTGGKCDDGDGCTSGDSCKDGACVGLAVDCTAPDDCHTASCQAGGCKVTALADGVTCTDGDACTQADACQAGKCQGQALACDAVPCQKTACVAGKCQGTPLPDGTTCTDGDSCTQTDGCDGGKCLGKQVDCNDGNACTLDSCAPASGCQHKAVTDGATCSDGNGCTESDSCQGGKCTAGTPKTCPAGADPCVVAVCVPAGDGKASCESQPAKPGVGCSDGAACTVSDACDGKGACAGTAKDCTSLDGACVTGVCDEKAGGCSKVNKADGTICDDAEACTLVDACAAGTCKGSQDACGEERLDVKAAATQAVSLLPVGGNRYVAHWLGSGAGENFARLTDGDGSREAEELAIAPSGGQQAGFGTRLNRTMAVDSGGNVTFTSFSGTVPNSASYYWCCGCPNPWLSQQFATLSLRRLQADGTLGALSQLTTFFQSYSSYGANCNYTISMAMPYARWLPLAFSDGSTGTLTFAPIESTGGQAIVQQALPPIGHNYLYTSADLAPAGSVALLASKYAYVADARVVPDGSDQFVVAWLDDTFKNLFGQVFTKTGTPVGSAVKVATGADLGYSRVLPAADGSYVVAWESIGQDGDGFGLYQRRIAPGGVLDGEPQLVHQGTQGDQRPGEIAALQGGGHVIVWQDSKGDPAGWGIRARRFLADGTPVGAEATINTQIAGDQTDPSVAPLADGGYVVAFRNGLGAVYTRRFDKNGKPVPGSPERPVPLDPAGVDRLPRVASQGQDVLVAWTSAPKPQAEPAVKVRLFAAAGSQPKAEVTLGSSVENGAVSVAAGAGKYLIGWNAAELPPVQTMRWVDAKGAALGDAFALPGSVQPGWTPVGAIAPDGSAVAVTPWSNGQGLTVQAIGAASAVGIPVQLTAGPSAMLEEAPAIVRVTGGYIVGWHANGVDGSGPAVVLRRVGDGLDVSQGAVVQANTTVAGTQKNVSLAVQGDLVVACWQAVGDVTDSFGIVCRLFSAKDLSPLSAEVAAHAPLATHQTQPTVAWVGAKTFAVGWTTEGGIDGAGLAVQAAFLDYKGKLLGPRVQVNRARAGQQDGPVVAGLPGGLAAYVWQSTGQDGASDQGGVHLRVLTAP